jgi:hypothetical protein
MIGLPGRRVGARVEESARAVEMDERETASRAALAEAGLNVCSFWNCVRAATHDVRWRRTWPGGSYETTSSYCEVHAAELEAGAPWASGDDHLVYLSAPQERHTAMAELEVER